MNSTRKTALVAGVFYLIWVRLCCSDYAAARGMTLLA